MKRKTAPDQDAERVLDLLAKDSVLPVEKLCLLAPAIVRLIDRKTEAALTRDDMGETPEERLFEALIARFEAMRSYRSGILTLAKAARKSPPLAAVLARAQIDSMRQALAFADGKNDSTNRALLLLCLYHFVFCVFECEDSASLPLTMKRLNSTLNTCRNILFYP